MGVFNLIKTPEVWWERRTEKLNDWYNYPWLSCSQDVTVDRFKIDTTTFKYVLNPAAGLTIQNMGLALVAEADYVPSYYEGDSSFYKPFMNPDFYEFVGKDPMTNQYKFTTKFIDGSCVGAKTFKVLSSVNPYVPDCYFGFWSAWRPNGMITNDTTVYLKIMLNLQRNNTTSTTQNVLYVATYPVTLKAGGYMQYWTNDPNCNDVGSTQILLPAADNEIISFCNSSQYYNSNRTRVAESDQQLPEQVIVGNGISVSPNPNTGKFILRLKPQLAELKGIKIVDINGRVVYSSSESQTLNSGFTKGLNINLPSGLYIVMARTERETLRYKFVIQK